ncbi:hypothetical protein ACCS70_32940 [Rhizobium ruizarguesonis]|nr:hypothetical protein [Rhizobium ruizarguesonis]MBY5877103.1 hypothetical protein [Rhizobium leguminosarum]NEH32715.1 hypothetical protein [Rhizobium ruizarguesonis]NEI81912.1 hypothetical protein [Rhizobium ruizarguesonis]NEJ10788.1 hypothetical protein [Rhizobium ruizarguesonis]NEJ91360.1 hypothetical protein [Rhizobium ruizarguesonis]
MNRRDKMHPNKARWDSPEMGLAFLDGERVVAPRRAIHWPAARNEHLDALCEVADSGRYYRVNRPVVTGMEPSLEKMSTLQQPSAEHEASIGLGPTKALLAANHEPERMGQITWSLSKSERVFDCAGGDSDNGGTIATDGQVEALANRGYINAADAYYPLVDRNTRSAKLLVDDEADTRPPKSYHEHVDFENCHYIDGTCRPWRRGSLKAGRLREIRQAVDIRPARHPDAALLLWH